ncbi:MAG: replicative DNA helicase [Phycisphaerales bacterium]|nr:MAG: replicative DNA helicase [Phycisphaerales bacterium]
MSTAPKENAATGSQPHGRIPPQDLDAEMALLGSMMMDRETVGLTLQIIGRQDGHWFYRPDHRKLFEVLIDIYDQNLPIDLVLVSNELRRRGLMDDIGGEDYMIQLAESFSDWANAEHYARIVRDKGMLRDLIRCTHEITDEAYGAAEDAKNILDEAERKLFSVTERRVSGTAVPLSETLARLARQLEARGDEGILTGVPTGFYKLDELTSGFQLGDLIIVAARPSMGKTALGLCMAEHMAVHEGRRVVFFSMEMSNEQVAQRLLCSHTRFDSHRLRRRMLGDDDAQRLMMGCDELARAEFYVDDTPGMTVLELRSKARRLAMQRRIDAVFIDYLQLMQAPGYESRQAEVAAISRGLKSLGRELNIPIIVMAQLNRMAEERQGHRPRMSDLRESGAIEQDADVILLIHREEYYRPDDESVAGQGEIIIAKQRNGPTDTVKVTFNKRSTRFENYIPEAAAMSYAGGPAPF